MADKPKTYPQKIQELQQQLEDALTAKAEAERRVSLIPELQQEIEALKDQLAAATTTSKQGAVSNKAQLTDLTQRAVSAEQGLRNSQAKVAELQLQVTALEQQLDIAGLERDKNSGKDEKIYLLNEELKSSNFRILSLNQQIKDKTKENEEIVRGYENQIRYLGQQLSVATRQNNEFLALAKKTPDFVTELKRIAGLI